MLSLIFFGITLLSIFLFFFGSGRDKRILVFSIIWLIVFGWLASLGYFIDTGASPPGFLLVLLGAILASVIFYRIAHNSKIRTDLLIAVHMVRIPVELILYHLYLQKEVPLLMTFRGYNFDIVIGISALILFLWMKSLKKGKIPNPMLIVWNAIGMVFLFIIVLMAILSSPTPIQQFAFEQPNRAVLRFPFIYLPAIVVPIVFVSHLLLIKNNTEKKKIF